MLAVSTNANTDIQLHGRISHAKELLGSGYKRSHVRKTEKAENISEFVESSIKNLVPKSQKNSVEVIAKTIMEESEKYGFDPIFLMAVIQNESSFNVRMKGSAGEIGLMQIKPDTAKWIATGSKISYKNAKSLYNPETNIRIGAAFMNKLRSQFSSNSQLYLTAYNAGAGTVRKMVSGKVSPKIYASAVMKRYLAIYSALGSDKGSPTELGALALLNLKAISINKKLLTVTAKLD